MAASRAFLCNNPRWEAVLCRTSSSRSFPFDKIHCSGVVGASNFSQGRRLFIVNSISPEEADNRDRLTVTVTVGVAAETDCIDRATKFTEKNSASEPGNDGGGTIDGSGGNGNFPGGGGGAGGEDDAADEEKEFGPILNYEDVLRETNSRGASLPVDMLEAAKTVGIREVLLLRYLDLQGSVWPLGFLMRTSAMIRNRMLVDPSFLFKIGAEVVTDSVCATFAEAKKRGNEFWAEFELYAADLLIGVVVNIALVGMLAPYARIGQLPTSQGLLSRIAALPSSVFEAERTGCRFSVNQRIGTYVYMGFLYGLVGFGCGIIGQGIANRIMTAKRSTKRREDDIPVPPLVKSAVLWGVFLAVSSNTRYQIVNGLERVVEASPMAKRVPSVAMGFTVGVRLANNVYGGMQFVDWARWSGVQ